MFSSDQFPQKTMKTAGPNFRRSPGRFGGWIEAGGVDFRTIDRKDPLSQDIDCSIRGPLYARERVPTRFYVVSELFGRSCVGVSQFFEPLRGSRL